MIRAVIAEFVGTFALVFAGTGAVVTNAVSGGALGHVGVAVTFGLVIMVMIYAVGHISGAHFNPAVTIAFALSRHFPMRRVIPYIAAQIAGATLGSLAVRFLIGDAGLGVTHPRSEALSALIFEAILTFVLMFVIVSVATDVRAVGQAAAIAIGGTVGLEAMFAGPITGASMNPARSLGPAIIAGDYGELWLYLIGPVIGAALGALLYQYLRSPRSGKELQEPQPDADAASQTNKLRKEGAIR